MPCGLSDSWSGWWGRQKEGHGGICKKNGVFQHSYQRTVQIKHHIKNRKMWSWGFRKVIQIIFFFFFSFASMSINLIAALDLGYLFLSLVEYYTSINRWGSCWSSWINKVSLADLTVLGCFFLNHWWIGKAIFESYLLNFLDSSYKDLLEKGCLFPLNCFNGCVG